MITNFGLTFVSSSSQDANDPTHASKEIREQESGGGGGGNSGSNNQQQQQQQPRAVGWP